MEGQQPIGSRTGNQAWQSRYRAPFGRLFACLGWLQQGHQITSNKCMSRMVTTASQFRAGAPERLAAAAGVYLSRDELAGKAYRRTAQRTDAAEDANTWRRVQSLDRGLTCTQCIRTASVWNASHRRRLHPACSSTWEGKVYRIVHMHRKCVRMWRMFRFLHGCKPFPMGPHEASSRLSAELGRRMHLSRGLTILAKCWYRRETTRPTASVATLERCALRYRLLTRCRTHDVHKSCCALYPVSAQRALRNLPLLSCDCTTRIDSPVKLCRSACTVRTACCIAFMPRAAWWHPGHQ